MTTYVVLGCLGSVVGRAKTISEAQALVLSQVPISTKTSTKLANRLASVGVGETAEVEYGGSGCTVRVEE